MTYDPHDTAVYHQVESLQHGMADGHDYPGKRTQLQAVAERLMTLLRRGPLPPRTFLYAQEVLAAWSSDQWHRARTIAP